MVNITGSGMIRRRIHKQEVPCPERDLLLALLLSVALVPLASQCLIVSHHQPSSSSSSSSSVNSDWPKLIPLSALDRYQEGADLRLFCSASATPSGSKLHFEWRKDGIQLNQNLLLSGQQQSVGNRLQITQMDDSASALRIAQLEAEDSGNYTCLVRNQIGQDSSTVRINVNVKLRWLKEPPSEFQVLAGKPVAVECDAIGQPGPLITWSSLKDHQTSFGRMLRIERAHVNDSGLYECRAGPPEATSGSAATSSAPSDRLRKLMRLIVNGTSLAEHIQASSGNPKPWFW